MFNLLAACSLHARKQEHPTGCATLCALRIVPLTFCVRVVAVSMTPQQMLEFELEFELEVLRKVDGCSGVNDFGTEGGPGQYGVIFHIRSAPGAPRKTKRIPCTRVLVTKLDAALAARAHVVRSPRRCCCRGGRAARA